MVGGAIEEGTNDGTNDGGEPEEPQRLGSELVTSHNDRGCGHRGVEDRRAVHLRGNEEHCIEAEAEGDAVEGVGAAGAAVNGGEEDVAVWERERERQNQTHT